jgi:hypothetical protein
MHLALFINVPQIVGAVCEYLITNDCTPFESHHFVAPLTHTPSLLVFFDLLFLQLDEREALPQRTGI